MSWISMAPTCSGFAGAERLPAKIKAPLAIGPELDADGLAELGAHLGDLPGIEVVPLWLRGRATGVMMAFGRPRERERERPSPSWVVRLRRP
jgi:hypothetical protein